MVNFTSVSFINNKKNYEKIVLLAGGSFTYRFS